MVMVKILYRFFKHYSYIIGMHLSFKIADINSLVIKKIHSSKRKLTMDGTYQNFFVVVKINSRNIA